MLMDMQVSWAESRRKVTDLGGHRSIEADRWSTRLGLRFGTCFVSTAISAPSSHTTTMLNLLCYVRGDDSHQAFEIEIDEAEFVGTLKEYIKEKNTHIPAHPLLPWNKGVPINSFIRGKFDAFPLVKDDSLYPHEILSDVFPSGPEKGMVYIIIDCPPGGN